MPAVAVTLTPVDRARRRIELPVITADDTPTRNPCKVKNTPNGRTFRNEPYGFKAVESGAPDSNNYAPPMAAGGGIRVAMPALSQDDYQQPAHAQGQHQHQPQPPETQLLSPVVKVGVRAKPKVNMMSMGLEAPEGTNGSSSSGSTPSIGAPVPISGDSTPAAGTGTVSTGGDTPGFSRQQTNESVATSTSTAPSPPKGLGIDSPPRGGHTPHTPAGQAQVGPASPSGEPGQDPSPSEAFASGGRESKFKSTKAAIPMTEKKLNSNAVAVVVKFKHQDGVFMIPEGAEPYREGDFVVVEGDRGEHVGRIDQMHIHHRHSTSSVGTIMRKAFTPEIDLVHRLRMQEPQITRQVQDLATTMDVAMEVIDTELQTDRNKVTVYYRSKVDGPVDFRQLQRRLFREFRCRIWFIDWDTM